MSSDFDLIGHRSATVKRMIKRGQNDLQDIIEAIKSYYKDNKINDGMSLFYWIDTYLQPGYQ